MSSPSFRFGRWVLLTTIGFVFALAALGAAYLALAPLTLESAAPLIPGMTVAGAAYGLVLGSFQFWAARGSALQLPRGRWIGASVIGGAVGWGIAVLPAGLAAMGVFPTSAIAWMSAVFVIPMFVSVAAAQSLVLRQLVTGPLRWLLWCGLGWSIGLPPFAFGFQLLNAPDTSPLIGIWAVGSLFFLAVVHAIATAYGMRGLNARRRVG